MGWLFGKKKAVPVPKVPFPQGRLADGETFSFPKRQASPKTIEPDMLKEAAGIEGTFGAEKEERSISSQDKLMAQQLPKAVRVPTPPIRRPFSEEREPLFIKVDVYQRILGEMEELKTVLTHINAASNQLERSEYNEENSFEKLKKAVKIAHDRLLQVDKIIYKAQGE